MKRRFLKDSNEGVVGLVGTYFTVGNVRLDASDSANTHFHARGVEVTKMPKCMQAAAEISFTS